MSGAGHSLLWDAETRQRVQADFDRAGAVAHAAVHRGFAMLDGRDRPDASQMMRAFLLGAGDQADPERHRIAELTDQVGRAQGVLADDDRFFHHPWRPKPEAVERLCPDLLALMFDARDRQGLDVLPLLDPCTNESLDLRFPPQIDQGIRRPWRPGLVAYAAEDVIAYVHPYQYQVISADAAALWVTGSPRYLTRTFLSNVDIERTDRTIVVIQDRFVFSNLAHFLFDGLPRVLSYATAHGLRGNELFVFGAIPGEYQALLCAALCNELGIPPEAIWFPQRAHLLHAPRCVWFSDQIEAHSHPGQMAHPHSVAALTRLCARVPAPTASHRRLYISRGDALRRRIHNETDLIAALSAHGVVPVRLAELSAEEQISLFRGAELVVAPHGQGLSHLVMGSRLGRIIELFHPSSGTDAYAWMAQASGIDYACLLGTEIADTPGDFSVDVETVVRMVKDGVKVARPSFVKAANLIPSSRDFAGFVDIRNAPLPYADAQLMWREQSVRLEAEPDPAGRAVEAGRWPKIEMGADRSYTVSCWVMLPEDAAVRRVELAIGDWPGQTRQPADTTVRNAWQRISTTAPAPAVHACHAAIMIEADSSMTLLSTCWQFERGEQPTAYAATALPNT